MIMSMNIAASTLLLSSSIVLSFAPVVLASSSSSSVGVDESSSSSFARRILNQNNNNNNNNNDYSYIDDDYHMIFQGCHHVQQWNDNAYEDDDVKIMTRRLVRYRLCGDCSSCNNDYGDYVVDMDDYLYSLTNSLATVCPLALSACGCGNDDADCATACYQKYDLNVCSQQNFLKGFTGCSEIKMNNNNNKNRRRRRHLEENNNIRYYMGAYCAGQGGSIQLGVFTDDTCTTFADDGNALYASSFGYELPFSNTTSSASMSLVSTTCKACDPYDEYVADADRRELNNNNQNQKSFCVGAYATAGKCETKMKIDYPNESSCNYIEGIKIIRDDGVIRTSNVHQSKAAAVFIGLLTTAAVLLGAYVYFLKTKLQRAQINLHASTQGMIPPNSALA